MTLKKKSIDSPIIESHQEKNGFNLRLASSIHDMKNSLSMLNHSLNQILDTPEVDKNCLVSYQTPSLKKHVGIVRYESTRVNNTLIQLLALYKLEKQELLFNPNYYNLYDFVEEQRLSIFLLLDIKSVQCNIQIDHSLMVFFDASLLSIVIENILTNTIRYSIKAITISAKVKNKGFSLYINDDGSGYPLSILEQINTHKTHIDMLTGSTGLGLHFARRIAEMHLNQSKKGHIHIRNGGNLKGGLFEIYIP
jgi:signal transduction histidine kinase